MDYSNTYAFRQALKEQENFQAIESSKFNHAEKLRLKHGYYLNNDVCLLYDIVIRKIEGENKERGREITLNIFRENKSINANNVVYVKCKLDISLMYMLVRKLAKDGFIVKCCRKKSYFTYGYNASRILLTYYSLSIKW